MGRVWLVGIGGFAGSIARYLVGGLVQARAGASFPFGTLAVNALGCLLIGALAQLAEARAFLSPDARAFLVIGVLGGFTTFSAFGHETTSLLLDGERSLAAANCAAHLVLAVGAVWCGRVVAHLVWR